MAEQNKDINVGEMIGHDEPLCYFASNTNPTDFDIQYPETQFGRKV